MFSLKKIQTFISSTDFYIIFAFPKSTQSSAKINFREELKNFPFHSRKFMLAKYIFWTRKNYLSLKLIH